MAEGAAQDGETKGESPTYLMSRDRAGSMRLSAQHWIFKERNQWLIHPKLAPELPPDAQVADLGTGNGLWAVEVAEQNPNFRLQGLDISDKQFPPLWTMPDNVVLKTYDLFDNPPKELQGQFDMVHIRLLMAAICGRNRNEYLGNIKKLLKPGGWLQWSEVMPMPVFTNNKDNEIVPGGYLPIYDLLDSVKPVFRAVPWIEELDKVLHEEYGFVDTGRSDASFRKSLLAHETDIVFCSTMELVAGVFSANGDEKTKEEADRVMSELNERIAGGCVLTLNIPTFYAQKPLLGSSEQTV